MTTGPTDEPTGAQHEDNAPENHGLPDEPTTAHPPGSMRFQDESTTPREPTVGELRAHKKAQRERAEREVLLAQEAETKRKRKRLLIGGVAAVGVVGVIAALYAATGSGNDVNARCVDPNGTVVSDNYCGGSSNYGSSSLIFLGGTGYRYNYGGSGSVGQKATGGSATAPKGSSISGSSGKSSSSVSRGGLGTSSGKSSGS